jgi:hypothetical protein
MKEYEIQDMSLWKKTTVVEAEAHPTRLRSGELKPFGYVNDQWEALKAKLRPGDELYRFNSSRESWGRLAGRAGIALVRQGKIIATVITKMN